MMRHLPRVIAVLALGAVLMLPVVLQAACLTDAECDNGDVCSVADTCVLASCQLGGGGDANNDLVCDAELDPSVNVNLTRLTLRRKTSARSDNSAVKGGGDLFAFGSAAGAFTGSSGFSIRVKDNLSSVSPPGDGIDATVTWQSGECFLKPVGTLACRTADRRASLKFKPNKIVAGQYKIDFKIKGVGNLTGPFFGPVRFVLSRDGNQRIADTITDCKLILSGLRCREF